MRLKTFLKLMPIVAIALVLESCLKGDPSNFPEGSQHPFFIMSNNAPSSTGATTNGPISGLANFGAQALGFPHSHKSDTVTFYISLEGTGYASKDIDVSLLTKELDASVLKANYSNDSLNYQFMPDSLYNILGTTGTIAKGTDYATFRVVFYTSKFDQSQNYMLPISAQSSSDPDIKPASNFGYLYYHAIGNPLAATYKCTYWRYNSSDTVDATTLSFPYGQKAPIAWSPINGTTLNFDPGYVHQNGLNAPFVVTFKQDPITGALSNFNVKIDASLKGGIAEAGFSIVADPVFVKISLTPTARYFKIYWKVNNGSADRSFKEEYWWP